jgi:riboflavin synthase
MFTGIVEETGTVTGVMRQPGRTLITIRASRVLEGTQTGDSVNIDGVCQTVSSLEGESFRVFTLAESLKKTTLGSLAAGDPVNLERALRAGTPLGGHIVQGHISCTVPVRELSVGGGNVYLAVELPEEQLRCCVPEGSVALHGISLTIAEISGNLLRVNIIPATFERTNLSRKKPGDRVNLETDIIGRYVQRLLAPYGGASSTEGALSFRRMKELGY